MTSAAEPAAKPRGRNPRGQGERLREEIVSAALTLLEELGDDEALSMRAVARATGTAATSVYLHFSDRDALVLAALERCHGDLVRTVDAVGGEAGDPVAGLRARALVLGTWAYEHPGLYKVLHESTLGRRAEMPFKSQVGDRMTAAVRECMRAGLVPEDDAAQVALDLRAAVHGAVSMRLNQPDHAWPPLEEQIERFLVKLVGVPAS
ncbi:TetR/AcrR family transcriptional regulator [Actinomadura rupiterrae]|uniref:TetR/AcrR family transcriptional regulator n=1 Tax=Actinomadura rupiterrae TaxID=559627 RepID=UPI0020A406EA|nr:TetR/AcrR family transcriptional regulator [Actinomadura rupiterrae]MCP2341547.1 AcrR family transcriptional regulator [Actinomadura rupiterrae]